MNYKIDNFIGGYNMAVEEAQLNPNETQNAQNVDISSGSLKTISGFSKYINVATAANIVRLMKHYHATDGVMASYLLASTASTILKWNGTSWDTLATGLSNGDFDFINYQQDSTDIIIMGNGTDAVKKWDRTTFANLGGSPPTVKSIGLHKERVWGTVNKSYPSRVHYSDDFDPENWTEGTEAAGFIDIPTWDGGVCIGLSTIFNDVVIFKTNNIFRIFGTYPGNYQVVQVYSSVGAIAERSIVSSADKAYFMTKAGLHYYDGVSTKPLLGDKLKFTMNPSYVKNTVSAIFDNKLYVAFPEGTSTVNNALIVYDLIKQNVMLRRGLTITDMMEYEDKLLFANGICIYQLESGTTFDGTAISAFYETPYTDLDMKNAKKKATAIYFTASGNGSIQIDLTFDGVTKSKTKELTSTAKVYKINVNHKGRRFKVKFSNVSGSTFEISSPELILEIDRD